MEMDYSKIINSSPVVMVEFYATWCPHCQKMMPVVEKVKMLLEGTDNVFQIDIDKEEALSDAQKVETIPTFIVYKDGVEVWRHSGEIEADKLVEVMQSYQ